MGQVKDAFKGLKAADMKLSNNPSARASIAGKVVATPELFKIAKGMAKGGVVDSVPAMLTPGEFVINKSSAQAIGYGNLKHINKYAAGGVVRKGRGSYGPGGEGGGGLGMLFAMDMAMSFAATLVDAESKLGAFLNTLIKVTSAFMAYQMLIKQGNVVKKTEIAATKMLGQTGTSLGGQATARFGPKGTPIFAPGGLQQQHVAPGRMWQMGGVGGGREVDAPGKWNKAKRMMGEKNARRLGRSMAWASDKTRKAGQNMEKFGGKALIAGMLLGQLGDAIKGWGMERIKATGGEGGMTSAGGLAAIGGGALSGAAMGGAMGMMVGGPWGAAIGAAIGGLYGFTTAAIEVSETLEKIAIDKGMKQLNDAFRDVSMGWGDLGTMGPEVERSLAALNVGAHGSAEAQKHAAQAAKQSMPKYMKAIKAFANESDTMDAFFSRMDEGSLRTFASLNSLPYDKLRKDIENQIQANKEAAVAARLLKESHLELERIERSMSVIDRAVAGASAQIADFGRAIDASMKTIKRPDLSAGVLDRPGGLTQREMAPGERLDKQLAALTSLLPRRQVTVPGPTQPGAGPLVEIREPELATTARENIKALSELGSALVKTRTLIGEQRVEGADAFSTFETELKKKATPAAVDAIMSGLRGTFKDEDEFAKAVRDPSERGKIQKAAERDLKRQLETLKRLGKFINKASKELAKAFQARTKLEQELVKEVGKLVDLQKQRFATMKKIRGQGKVTPEESERFFQKKQVARLGAVGEGGLAAGGQVDVAGLGGRYRELNQQIMDSTAQMNKFGEGLQAGETELDRTIRLNNQIAEATSKLKTLGTVIADYQNVQQRTAALQEKINQLNQQAAKRRSMVDQYAGATDEARAEMDRVADMARRISDGTESFANVPQDLRGQVISFVQDMASQGGPIGDKFKGAAGDIRVETARRMGVNLTPDMEKQLREQPTSEVEKLGKEIDKAFQNAIDLQTKGIIAGITDQQQMLNTALEALKTVITDELPRALAEQTKEDNNQQLVELIVQSELLSLQLAVLEDLRTMGVNVDDPAAVRSVQEIAKNEYVQQADMLKERASAAKMATMSGGGDLTIMQRGRLAQSGRMPSGGMFPFKRDAAESKGQGFHTRMLRGSVFGETGWSGSLAGQVLESGLIDAISGVVLKGGEGGEASDFVEDIGRVQFTQMMEKLVTSGQKTIGGQDITPQMIAGLDSMKKLLAGKGTPEQVLAEMQEANILTENSAAGFQHFVDLFNEQKSAVEQNVTGVYNSGELLQVIEAKIEASRVAAESASEDMEEKLVEAMKRSGVIAPDKQEKFRARFMSQKPEDIEWRKGLMTLEKGQTADETSRLIEKNREAMDTLNTTNASLNKTIQTLNQRLEAVGAGGKQEGASIDNSERGKPGELPGGDNQKQVAALDPKVKKNLQDSAVATTGMHHASVVEESSLAVKWKAGENLLKNIGDAIPLSGQHSQGGWRQTLTEMLPVIGLHLKVKRKIGEAYETGKRVYRTGAAVVSPTKNLQAAGTGFLAGAPGGGASGVVTAIASTVVAGLWRGFDAWFSDGSDGGGGGGEKAGEQPGDERESRKTLEERRADIRERHGLGGGGGGGGGGGLPPNMLNMAQQMIPGGMQGLMAGLPLPLPVTIAGFGAGGFGDMMGGAGLGGASGGIMGTGISWNPLDWIGKPFGLGSADEGPGPAERAGAKMGLRSRVAGPGGFTPAGKGVGHPDMEKWTKSMTSLSTQMGAFTEAFQGGMVWTIEGTHDINVNLNGAEVFGSLTEMFESYVGMKTTEAIKLYFKINHPHLAVGAEALGGLLGF